MESQWHIVPEFTSLRYMAQLLSQGLRLKDLKKLLRILGAMENQGWVGTCWDQLLHAHYAHTQTITDNNI
jgi:hypothetical protein